jgi:hypothetical protein
MLSLDRLKYIEGIQKYARFSVVTTIVIAIVVLIVFVINHTVIQEKELPTILHSPFFSVIIIALLLYCFIFYRIKRRSRRLQELIEQMSDDDFQFLLQAQSSLSFYYKYAPNFVICRDHLYLFTLFEIKEIDPKKVQKVRCHYIGRGSNLVEILSPETTRFEVYTSAYPYLEKLIRKYNPNADIEV